MCVWGGGQATYLAFGIIQIQMVSALMCPVRLVLVNCLWASWCLAVRIGLVQSNKKETLLSSGDTAFKHIDKGYLRASALTKYK